MGQNDHAGGHARRRPRNFAPGGVFALPAPTRSSWRATEESYVLGTDTSMNGPELFFGIVGALGTDINCVTTQLRTELE